MKEVRRLTDMIWLKATGEIEDRYIENYLLAKEKAKKKAKSIKFKTWGAIAACLAVVMLTSYGVSYIPKKEYVFRDNTDLSKAQHDIWVYYVGSHNVMLRERVRYYSGPGFEPRCMLWKEYNNIGDDVEIVEYNLEGQELFIDKTGNVARRLPASDEYLEYYITISNDILNYPNHEMLLKALEKTLANDTSIDAWYLTVEE